MLLSRCAYAAPAAACARTLRASTALRAPPAPCSLSSRSCSRSSSSSSNSSRRHGQRLVARAEGAVASPESAAAPSDAPITLTDAALAHLKKLRAESGGDDLLLRVGVKQGGCSGLSYVMDFAKPQEVKEGDEDYVFSYEGGQFRLVCDSKSLLYLYGMKLDHSDALIGGGFQFQNPNAQDSCGCGKSFGV